MHICDPSAYHDKPDICKDLLKSTYTELLHSEVSLPQSQGAAEIYKDPRIQNSDSNLLIYTG